MSPNEDETVDCLGLRYLGSFSRRWVVELSHPLLSRGLLRNAWFTLIRLELSDPHKWSVAQWLRRRTLDTSGRGVCGFESWPVRGRLLGHDGYQGSMSHWWVQTRTKQSTIWDWDIYINNVHNIESTCKTNHKQYTYKIQEFRYEINFKQKYMFQSVFLIMCIILIVVLFPYVFDFKVKYCPLQV